MKRTIASAVIAYALIALADTEQTNTQQWIPQHEGTAVPVTVYDESGSWNEYKYNYHSNKYYRSNTGKVGTTHTTSGDYNFDQFDYSFSWSMYDPAPSSSGWGW